jgi:hypothetical protein
MQYQRRSHDWLAARINSLSIEESIEKPGIAYNSNTLEPGCHIPEARLLKARFYASLTMLEPIFESESEVL